MQRFCRLRHSPCPARIDGKGQIGFGFGFVHSCIGRRIHDHIRIEAGKQRRQILVLSKVKLGPT